jgi:hypothetical protein
MTSIGLASDRATMFDPVTGFGDRHKLMRDLAAALEPGCPPSVLAVFELVGFDHHRRVFGERASAELAARLARRFASVVFLARSARPFGGDTQPAALCYRARQNEFCALVNMPFENVCDMLDDATHALTDERAGAPACGAVLLPDEVADPVEALMLADQGIWALVEGRGPRERRQAARDFQPAA